MKREFKFRIWDFRDKKFIYNPTKTFLISLDGYLFDVNGCSYDENYPIQQYIGLKDRNERGVYEGDILLCTFRRERIYAEVHFHLGTFLIENRAPSEFLQYNEVEIAGNIFETPNLLEFKYSDHV